MINTKKTRIWTGMTQAQTIQIDGSEKIIAPVRYAPPSSFTSYGFIYKIRGMRIGGLSSGQWHSGHICGSTLCATAVLISSLYRLDKTNLCRIVSRDLYVHSLHKYPPGIAETCIRNRALKMNFIPMSITSSKFSPLHHFSVDRCCS